MTGARSQVCLHHYRCRSPHGAQAGPTGQAFYDGLSLGKSPLNGPFPFPGRVPVLFLARLAELLVDLGPGLLILTLLLALIIFPGPTWPWFGFVYARVRPPWPSWFWLVWFLVCPGPGPGFWSCWDPGPGPDPGLVWSGFGWLLVLPPAPGIGSGTTYPSVRTVFETF